jgi:hypothetical protein
MAEASRVNIDFEAHLLEATARSVERRRGHFSFLTWPFFLAQMAAADQFFGDALRPALAVDEAAKTARSGFPEDSAEPLLPEQHRRLSSDEDVMAATRDVARTDPKAQHELAEPGSAVLAKQEEKGTRGDDQTSDSSGVAANAGGAAATADAAGDDTRSTAPVISFTVDMDGTGQGSGSPISLALSPQDVSTDVTSMLLGIVPRVTGNALGSIASTLDSTSFLVSTTTDVVAGLAGSAVGVVETIVNDAGSMLGGATNAVVGLTDGVLESIAPILEGAGSTLSTGTAAASELADGVLDSAGSLAATAGSVLTFLTEMAAQSTGGLVNAVNNVADGAGSLLGATSDVAGGIESVVMLTDNVLDSIDPTLEAAGSALSAGTGAVAGLAIGLIDTAGSLGDVTGSVLASVTETAADASRDLIHTAEGSADDAAGSLLGAASQMVSDAGGALPCTIEPLLQSADPVLARATDTIDDLTATATDSITSVLQGVGIDSALADVVTELAGDAIGLVAGTASDATSEAKPDEPAGQLQAVASSAKALMENTLVEEGGALSLGHGLASGGVLAFDEIPPLDQVEHDLPGSTGYSQHRVAISTGAADASNHANSGSGDGGPAHGQAGDNSVQQMTDKHEIADGHDGAADTAATSLVSHAISIVDDIGLRSDNLL